MRYLKTFNESKEHYIITEKKKTIHTICNKYNITDYKINDDLSVDVNRSVNLYERNLTKLPLQFRNVTGDFDISRNYSLECLSGCPSYVGGDFYCNFTAIKDLVGSPRIIDGDFSCCNVKSLVSLTGHPDRVGDAFSVSNGSLTSVNLPIPIGGDLNITKNQISYIENIPESELTYYGQNYITNIINKLNSPYHLEGGITEFINMSFKEIIDRLNEFEVIKDLNKIDLISLNSLYDFYNAKFDPDNFRNIPGYQVY